MLGWRGAWKRTWSNLVGCETAKNQKSKIKIKANKNKNVNAKNTH
jgi:hypothetical protein